MFVLGPGQRVVSYTYYEDKTYDTKCVADMQFWSMEKSPPAPHYSFLVLTPPPLLI